MRPALLLTLLLSSACVTGSALAQGSNWIDPPAKSDSAAGGERRKGAETSAPETATRTAAKPARPEAEPEAPHRAAATSRRETRRDDRARAAGMRRARRDAIRERARAQSRAARIDRPAPSLPATSMARGEPDARFSDWAVTARRLSLDYLDSVSAPNGAMLADAPRFYGPQVRFFGRTMSLGALMAEKRSFVRRWPERRYEPQGEPKVACDGASATCQVRIVHDFTALSPARGARSQGLAELTLTVSFADGRPVIVSESSRVLSRAGA